MDQPVTAVGQHPQGVHGFDPAAAMARMEEMMPELRSLFLAAAKPGVAGIRNRLPAFVRAFRWWMAEASETFQLGVQIRT